MSLLGCGWGTDWGAGVVSTAQKFKNDVPLWFGTSKETAIEYSTTQTNEALTIALDDTNPTLIVGTKTNLHTTVQDWALGAASNPQIVVTSAAFDATHWVRIYFDPTGYGGGPAGIIDTGAGPLILQDEVISTSHIRQGNDDAFSQGNSDDSSHLFNGTDLVWTFASLAATDFDGGDWRVTAQAGGTGGTGNHDGGDCDLISGVKAGTGVDGDVNLQGNALYVWDRAKTANTYGTIDAGQTTAATLSIISGSALTSGIEIAAGAGDITLDSTGTILLESSSGVVATGTITANDAAGPAFADEAATTTNPTLIPDKAEMDTGIGWASDTLHFILGGASYGNITTTGLTLAGSLTVGSTILSDTANTDDLGTTAVEWRAGYFGEDRTTATACSTSGLYLGLTQEARLRYNKDATGYPANALILGLEVSGTAAKDSLAFSSATISGFTNVTNDTAGEAVYAATQGGGPSTSGNGLAAGTWTIETGAGSDAFATEGGDGGAGGSLAISLGLGGALDGGGATGAQGTLTVDGPVVVTPATSIASYQATHNGIAATSTDGLLLTNTSATSAGTLVEMSPRTRWHGEAYRTGGGAERQAHDWIAEVLPVTAAGANTTSSLKFGHSLNGAAYTYPMTLTNNGTASLSYLSASVRLISPRLISATPVTLDIQNVGTYSSADVAISLAAATATNTTGEFVATSIAPTINQASGDGSWIGLLLDVTTTAVGSGGGEFLVFKDDSTTMFAISAEGGINMATGADLTIATGVVAYGGARMHRIVVEGGAGSGNDALTSITGGVDGDEIIIAPKTSGGADTVTVTDGGTLDIAGDFAMDSTSDRMHLRHDGTNWVEISRSSNA